MRARLACVVVVLGLGVAVPALAQPGATLDRFRPGETPQDDFHVSRPTDLGHLRFGAQLTLDYGLNPLVYEEMLGDPSSERFAVVEHQLNATVGLSLGLFDRVVAYAGLPVALVMQGADATQVMGLGVGAADGAGLGDAYVGARVRLFGESDEPFALAAQATVTFPTSIDGRYRGDPTVTLQPELVAELRPIGALRIVANVGVRIREESASPMSNLHFGHELTYALGLALPVWTDAEAAGTHLDVLAQIYGDSAFDSFGQREGTALEATAGLRFFHASGVVIGLAGGPGLNRGFGSPDLRGILTLGWAMPPEGPPVDSDGDGFLDPDDGCPAEPEDVDTFEDTDGCPDPDNDGDGVLDSSDRCPMEPETTNGFEDDDGCPDEVPDTDGDGLRDDVDQCVEEPEDRDGWQDEDGCPESDNDDDGVLDSDDRCPREPGVPANGGCPDPDRDGDHIVDRLDNCPDEPGVPERQGCRDEQRVVIESGRLEILEAVFFRTNGHEILSRSFPLLENVARVLVAHPDIERIIIEGHTDARGSRDRNVALSQRRAESVMTFMTEHGVAASRLIAQGFGPDRPRVENAHTAAEHAQNRRVEFNIPSSTEGIEIRESEASSEAIDR